MRRFLDQPRLVVLTGLILATMASRLWAGTQLAVAWNDPVLNTGMVRAMSTTSPWKYTSLPLAVGRNPILRYAEQKLFVVSPTDDSIQVVDPTSWKVEESFTLPFGSAPTDIAVVDAQTAYVSPRSSAQLYRLNLGSGTVIPVADLSQLTQAGGLPDLGTLTHHNGRLFVQVQRFADATAAAGYLAVVDLATEELIDADPSTIGIQAVELAGTFPKLKMQIVESTHELFVSATGAFFDEGGIEAIDLDTLLSRGLVIAEADGDTAADLGAFVMLTSQDGYLTFSTDFAASSHLHQFSRTDGVDPVELHVSVPYLAPALVHDPTTGHLFLPQGGFASGGVHVFDVESGAQLTSDVITFGVDPTDLVLIPPVPEPPIALLLIGMTVMSPLERRAVNATAHKGRPGLST